MKQRFLRDGLRGFEPHQILEMLLFYAIPRKDTNGIAHELLGTFGSLAGVLKADYDDLLEVKGMTPGAAALIRFSGQLVREYYDSDLSKDMILDSTDKMGKYILPKFFGEVNEKVLLVCLDNKCKVLHCSFVSEGSMNATEIHVRRILEQAIRTHATAVVIAHNHPSGFALPSIEDQQSTKALVNALYVAGIQLVDHLVVADDDYVSMRSTPSMVHLFRPDDTRKKAISTKERGK